MNNNNNHDKQFISQTVFTNTEGSNTSWLQAYKKAIKESNDSDRSKERREDYSHPSQTYADYLDYKEEWQYATDLMIDDVKKSYIYRIASSKSRIECKCGQIHTLTLIQDREGDQTVVDDPTTAIWQSCWYRTISDVFCKISKYLAAGAAEFPDVLSQNLTEIVQWKIAKSGRTPTLLPYDTYKEVWWNIDVNGGDTDLSVHIVSLMRASSARILRERAQEVREPMVQRYFFKTQEILKDHGFHCFIRSQSKIEGDILRLMNRLRRQVGYYEKSFKVNDVRNAINACPLCDDSVVNTSPFGVYCAPPGAGKTTAQNSELLVGFDTDWIGIGPTWRDYSFLLRRGIPIITNQVNLFRGSGVKIQLAIKRNIRKDTHGKPMANFHEVLRIGKMFPDAYVIHRMKRKEFLSNHVLAMTAMAHFTEVNMSLFINRKTIWQVSERERDFLNEFGRKMRDLAIGKVKVNEYK